MHRKVLGVLEGLVVLHAASGDHQNSSSSCSGGCACRTRLAVCIPTAPSKDMRVFGKSLASVVAHLTDVDETWVVSRPSASVSSTIERANAVAAALGRPAARWLDEGSGNFPFDYASVQRALEATRESYAYAVGWYLQQLIKLYCGRAIALDRGRPVDTLVLDSDVVFFRPVAFVDSARVVDGRCDTTYRYAFSREHHSAYVATNAMLLGLDHPAQPSGVVHHMVMRADVLELIEAAVFERHGKPLWATLIDLLTRDKPRGNVFSEYQLYFHFARLRKPRSVALRQLYWANGPGPRSVVECSRLDRWPDGHIRPAANDDDATRVDRQAGYDYVAYHSYAKRRNCVYAPYGDQGVCFGPGCTFSCYKRPDEAKYKRLNRSLVAPRLCAQPHLQTHLPAS